MISKLRKFNLELARELSFSSRNFGISRNFGKDVEENVIQERGKTMKKFEIFWVMKTQEKV